MHIHARSTSVSWRPKARTTLLFSSQAAAMARSSLSLALDGASFARPLSPAAPTAPPAQPPSARA